MFTKMPKRTTVTLPDHIVPDLENWAKIRGQGFATVCALAIELGVKSAKASGDLLTEPDTFTKKESKTKEN